MRAGPPSVRIFVPTYRRPRLLRRALASLLGQSRGDWVAEVHNDEPSDPEPARIVAEIGDPRIHFVQHEVNWGALCSFNHFYASCSEPHIALLEDDNAWLPCFLERMLDALDRHPGVTLAWCNQRVLEERTGNQWLDTGRTVNPPEPGVSERLVGWPQPRQALGALHANGAMLLRTCAGRSYRTPLDLPFGGVEHVRERLTPQPMLYVPEPLACFAVTLSSAQSRDREAWGSLQMLLAGSYLRHADAAQRRELLGHARGHNPLAFGTLLQASLAVPGCRGLLREFRPVEWLRWLAGVGAHPLLSYRIMIAARRHPDWWQLLDQATAERFGAERGRPFPGDRGQNEGD